ncbi:MAG: ABC transporter ATP-binding protein [Synergistaceae bacterium]|jgi:ABC-2 type transport system ATP-binding protein|nr:ABC transporter ATP-binding protein [Synergistaceae bacterium]
MSAVLEFKSVTKTYGQVTALSRAEITAERGEIFGIVGPDGAGKSTMLRLAMGLISPDSGEIRLFGQGAPGANRTRVGYVPQRFSLYQNLTVLENISLYSALYAARTKAETQTLVKNILTRIGLWEFRERLAGVLSGGMKQKLMLAVCLAHSPEALFLDEPSTGVDPLSRRDFWAALYELKAGGVTIVVSTPYMDEAELCTNLILLSRGEIIKRGAPDKLLEGYGQILDVYFEDAPDSSEGFKKYAAQAARRILDTPGVLAVNAFGSHYHVEAEDLGAAIPAIRRALDSERSIDTPGGSSAAVRIEIIPPSLEDLFISSDTGNFRAPL